MSTHLAYLDLEKWNMFPFFHWHVRFDLESILPLSWIQLGRVPMVQKKHLPSSEHRALLSSVCWGKDRTHPTDSGAGGEVQASHRHSCWHATWFALASEWTLGFLFWSKTERKDEKGWDMLGCWIDGLFFSLALSYWPHGVSMTHLGWGRVQNNDVGSLLTPMVSSWRRVRRCLDGEDFPKNGMCWLMWFMCHHVPMICCRMLSAWLQGLLKSPSGVWFCKRVPVTNSMFVISFPTRHSEHVVLKYYTEPSLYAFEHGTSDKYFFYRLFMFLSYPVRKQVPWIAFKPKGSFLVSGFQSRCLF